MPGPSTADQLQANLSEILDSTRLMLQALEAERQALTDNDIKALDEAAAQKSTLASRLERLDQARTDLVCQHQAEHQRQGALNALLDASGELKQLWSAVTDAVSDCDRLNQVNGTALRVRQDSVNRTLGLLHGGESHGSALYDEAGHARTGIMTGPGTTLGRV